MVERSSVVRPPPRSKVRVEVPHPSEKYMKSFGEHEVATLCERFRTFAQKHIIVAERSNINRDNIKHKNGDDN